MRARLAQLPIHQSATTLMSATIARIRFTAIALLGVAAGCANERERVATTTAPDSAAAVAAALDTLRRLGAKDYVVDSLVRRADTVIVWAGPRVWMATDRPTSAVSVMAPARIVGVRQIFGG
jgi:hypothetical protein